MQNTGFKLLLLTLVIFSVEISSAGIRDHTRPVPVPGTRVSQSQADDLSLTLVTTTLRNLQTWIRLAAVADSSRQNLSAKICTPDAALIQSDQRIRAFSPDSISSIYSARINQLSWKENCLTLRARLASKTTSQAHNFVMEIIVQRGQFLAIPKEAIIEEGDRQIVYIQQEDKGFAPQEIHTGLHGELYTQVLHGLKSGDRVATFGSFFIDAEYKLKSGEADDNNGSPHAHHHH